MDEDRTPESAWRHSWWRRSARSLWRSADDHADGGLKPLGLWLTADTVVIAHADRLQAFRATTGEPLWTWRPPGRQTVALVSPDLDDGAVVVLHCDDGRRDAKRVGLTWLAVDTGEVVRRRKQDAALLGHIPAKVTLGGGLLATAGESWKDWETRPVMRALDLRTGEIRWKHDLTDPGLESVSVISAQPFVATLRTRARRTRAEHRLLVLDDDGTDGVTLAPPDGYERFGERIAVTGDVLVVGLVPRDRTELDRGNRLGAYSLSTGAFLWEWHGEETYQDTHLAHQGRLLVVHEYGGRLSVLDPADGRTVARRKLRGTAFESLVAASGDLVAVACEAGDYSHGLRVFRWR
ncbi:PQQ-binding-like beta-propeller repeat protein [Streptomyces sp. NPDC050528]|uniref:outer membrane protein assembly factor BamB family protein n=1 Tax=Streptomyces sp. NPDC050528 TaxID=3365623 RepID=UPI00379CF7FA